VRRVARGLGSLARNTGLLAFLGITSFAAAGAAAAPAPRLFELTISATSVADFDRTGAPTSRLGCETSSRAEGFRTAVFRSSRPTLVRFVGGRIQTMVLHGLTGTVKLSGTNTENAVCAGQETHTPQYCSKTTRTFKGARALLSSAASGSMSVAPPRVALLRIRCPLEPKEVVALPLGPGLGPLQVPVATLTNPRTTRITLTASARRTKNYGAPEAGFVQQRTAWKFTLVRTGR
jgi:hypothetical protein